MRLLGLLPPNGTGALFAIVLIFYFIAAVLGLSGFIIVTSMTADVVEDTAVETGQRSEGLESSTSLSVSPGMVRAGSVSRTLGQSQQLFLRLEKVIEATRVRLRPS